MKVDIHPKIHPVVFIDTSTGAEFLTTSTLTSDEKKKINGVDHYVLKVEISSTSHPFYTGKRKLVDTAGRVDKFRQRAEKAKAMKAKTTKTVDEGLDEVLHNEEEEKEVKEEPVKKGILEVRTSKDSEESSEKEETTDSEATEVASEKEENKKEEIKEEEIKEEEIKEEETKDEEETKKEE